MTAEKPLHAAGHPLSVPCPRCPAGVDELCETPKGVELERPHKDRARRAEHVAEQARLRAEGDAEHRITSKRWRRVYAAARLELEQRAAWTKIAAEQLESVCRNMALAEVLRAKAEAKPIVPGSMGQDVVNPAVDKATRLDAQALATARALKLTPDTRGTSAAPTGDPDAGTDEGGGGEVVDELAELDEVARARKAKAAQRRARG